MPAFRGNLPRQTTGLIWKPACPQEAPDPKPTPTFERLLRQPARHRSGPVLETNTPVARPPIRIAVLLLCLTCLVPTNPLQARDPVQLTGLYPPTLDHRPLQSPVKNQGARGTCIAFSVAAVMETFDGVPSNLSEQGAYGFIKLQEFGKGEVSSGGLLANYPEFLQRAGFMHESVAPYDPKAGLWSRDDNQLKQYLEEGKTSIADLVKRAGTTRYMVQPENIIFLGDPAARDIAAIKRLLASGHRAVAVGYTHLYSPRWSTYKSGVITPDEGFRFVIGDTAYGFKTARALRPKLVDEVLAGTVKVRLANPEERDDYGGHAVTVVGYTADGFIIKNSWGGNWGVNGYGIVSFDYHRIFCDEALAVKEPTVITQPGNPLLRPILYLKSCPTSSGTNASLRLSLFGPKEGGLPGMRRLQYEIYEQKPDGSRGRLIEFPPPGISTRSGTGHPVDVLQGAKAATDAAETLYWVQITFASGDQSMERIVTFPNVTWANREYRGF